MQNRWRATVDQMTSNNLLKWCRPFTNACFYLGPPLERYFGLYLLNIVFVPAFGVRAHWHTGCHCVGNLALHVLSLLIKFGFQYVGHTVKMCLTVIPPKMDLYLLRTICCWIWADDQLSLLSIAENSSHGKPPDSKGRVSSLLHKPEFPDTDMMEVLIWAEDSISGVLCAYSQVRDGPQCANLKN